MIEIETIELQCMKLIRHNLYTLYKENLLGFFCGKSQSLIKYWCRIQVGHLALSTTISQIGGGTHHMAPHFSI